MIEPNAPGCDRDDDSDANTEADDVSEDALDRVLRIAFGGGQATVPSRLLHLPTGSVPLPRVDRFALSELDHAGSNLEAGRYSIGGELGRGGVGAVYEAHDAELGRELALKVLLEDHLDNASMSRRFVEEAQISGQLQHPGIVPVHQLGSLDDGRLFFSMKLVRGQTLEDLLAARPDLETDRQHCLVIFQKICQTVAYAHSRGVIHRDLKPANVMVGAFGEVQVLDWGLAKVLGRGEGDALSEEPEIETLRSVQPASASMPGSVMGTPSYMSPEQARGEVDRLDERTDVFGLGAILCEIIAARPPYEGKTSVEVRERAARGDVGTAVDTISRCGADPEVRALATRCLSSDPDDRPRDAGEVAEEIDRYLESLEERARASELEAAEARVRASEERRARRLTVGLGVLTLALVVGAAWWTLDRAERRSETTGSMRSALTQAEELLETGLPARDRAQLERGRDLARHALSLRANAPVSREVVHRAETTLAELDLAIERSGWARRLERIRVEHGDDPEWVSREPGYSAVFDAMDIGVDTFEEDEVARRILNSGIPVELTIALDDWARFRRKADPDGDGWRRLGRIASRTGRDDASNRIRTALARDDRATLRRLALSATPKLPGAAVLLGATLLELDEVDLARAVFAQARVTYPGDYWIQHGSGVSEILRDPPDYRASVAHYEAALAVRPKSAHARIELAGVYDRLGESERSVSYYREALRLDPALDRARILLARVLRGLKRFEPAESLYREATTGSFAVTAWTELGIMLRATGQRESSADALVRAIEADPKRVGAHVALALLRADERKFELAVSGIRLAIEREPDSATLYNELAAIEWKRESIDAAIVAIERAIVADPNYAQAHLSLGELRQEKGELHAARLAYDRSLELDPNSARAWFKLGTVFESLGDIGWIDAFRRAADLGGLRPRARTIMFNVLLKPAIRQSNMGQVSEAAVLFGIASALDPDELDRDPSTVRAFDYYHAYTLQMIGDYSSAASVYSGYVDRDRVHDELHIFGLFHLGQCLEQIGRFEHAARRFARAVELCRSTASPHTADAERWNREAQVAVALIPELPAFDAGEREPTTPQECLALARIVRQRDRPATAAHYYQRWLDTAVDTPAKTVRVRRYNAAGCAIAASLESDRTDSERREWRMRALAHLRANLSSWSSEPETAATAPTRRVALGHWLRDVDLTTVRDPQQIAELDRDERRGWLELWRDHAGLLP